jgi:hypothetical protein
MSHLFNSWGRCYKTFYGLDVKDASLLPYQQTLHEAVMACQGQTLSLLQKIVTSSVKSFIRLAPDEVALDN